MLYICMMKPNDFMRKKYFILAFVTLIYIIGFTLSFPYIVNNISANKDVTDSFRNFLEYGIMFVSFIIFNSLLWKNKFTRLASIFLILLVGINFFISLSCFFIYGSGFNIGMTISVLETNVSEAASMSSMFILPLAFSFLFILLLLYTVTIFSKTRISKAILLLSSIWILMPIAFNLKHTYISNKGGGKTIKNVTYHLMDFINAYDLYKDIKIVKNKTFDLDLKKIEDGVDNIILVIGESATPKHMSLYGYSRKTTPQEDAEKEHMYIFNNAVSPAGITNLSVPLLLSTMLPQDYQNGFKGIHNNIISMANTFGYETHWYSTQGIAKSITAISTYAQNKKWLNGYDEVLLPYVEKALQKKGKKLIILHINGSHPNPCDKIPASASYFNENNHFDCYDNSIKYTDEIIGKLFGMLKNTLPKESSALFYVSDHSLKFKGTKYLHTDSKESTQVPFYIWNSPKVPESIKLLGSNDQLTQATVLLPIMARYLGLSSIENYKNNELKYLKLDLNVIDYEKLE